MSDIISMKRFLRLVMWIFIVMASHYWTELYEDSSYNPKVIKVYASEDMKSAFSTLVRETDDFFNYRVEMVSNKQADIYVEYGKESDKSYIKVAKSPFIVAYDDSRKTYKRFEKESTIVESKYNNDDKDFDFFKVIDTAVNEKDWSEIGFDEKPIILCPSKDSIYWQDFYKFMLVNVNGGKYPENDEQLENAENVIESFYKAPNVESVNDFEEKLKKIGEISKKIFLILPEEKLLSMFSGKYEDVRIYYPTVTTDFNYYIKSGSEEGEKILKKLNTNTEFFKRLLWDSYCRSENTSYIPDGWGSGYKPRDSYVTP